MFLTLSKAIQSAMLLTFAYLLSSCATTKEEEPKGGLSELIIRPPTSELEEWKEVRMPYSRFYITSKDQASDEDLIALFVEAVPLMRPMTSEGDLLAYVSARKSADMIDLSLDQLVGRELVRFQRLEEDRAGNPQRFRDLLGLRRRASDGDYSKRSKGVMIVHPNNPSEALSIGVWRNSFHGQIGEHFEEVAANFVASFLASNGLAGDL